MTEPHRPRVKYVIGLTAVRYNRGLARARNQTVGNPPQGRSPLPQFAGGLLSLEEACSRYTLTVDEFLSWQFSIDQHGLAGLRTTRIQQYRQ